MAEITGKITLVRDPKTDIRTPQERFIEDQISFRRDVEGKPKNANVTTSLTSAITVPWTVGFDYGCKAIYNNSAGFTVLFRAMNKKDLALQKISFVNWFWNTKFWDKRIEETGFPHSGGYSGTTDFTLDLYMTIWGDNSFTSDKLMIIYIGKLKYIDNYYGSPNNGQGLFIYESINNTEMSGLGNINILETAIPYRAECPTGFDGDWRGTNEYNQPDAITVEQINNWFISTDNTTAYDTFNVSISSDISLLSSSNFAFMQDMFALKYLEFVSTHSILFRGNQSVYKVTRTI